MAKKVLIAFTDNDSFNPFVKELKFGIEKSGCIVKWSLKEFWLKRLSFDIVHIQWPEYLFAPFEPLDEKKLEELENTLDYWKRRSKIVLTRHNIHPNYVDHPILYERLYNIVYSYCDSIVHLGPYGLDSFSSIYSTDIFGHKILHKIIPHHIYIDSYPNEITSIKARELLHIPNGRLVVLIFGRIRFREERYLLKSLFKSAKNDGLIFLVPSWLPFAKGRGVRGFLRKLYYRFRLYIMNMNGLVRVSDDFIGVDQVQLYFNASDMVLIPRVDGLNSGNITLSFFFKKVVIGPDRGNISFELKESGNPVYDPNTVSSMRDSIKEGTRLLTENRGVKNFDFGFKYRHPFVIGNEYNSLYDECIREGDGIN